MAQQIGKVSSKNKKSRPSYLYAIVSVTLVLFMLGILGVLLVYWQSLTDLARENFEVNLELKEEVNEVDVIQFQKKLELEPYIKSTRYVSKEEAAKMMEEEYGNFVDVLGHNPLFSSVVLNMKAVYMHPDSLETIEASLRENPLVRDVYYDKGTLGRLVKTMRTVSIVLGTVALVLFIITISLVDNTIKLLMYSNRFLIRSMQLVGATRWFIIKPFLMQGVFNGFVSGVVALLALVGILYWAQVQFPVLTELNKDLTGFSLIFVAVLITGVLISWLSTWRAVSKYLRMKLDDLY